MAGWGKYQFSDTHYGGVLKKIDLPIVPRHICQDQLRKTRLGQNYTLPRGLICAGGEKDNDACTGDGGGALFCPMTEDPKQFEQIGIVNWGVGCKEKTFPPLIQMFLSLSHGLFSKLKKIYIHPIIINYLYNFLKPKYSSSLILLFKLLFFPGGMSIIL